MADQVRSKAADYLIAEDQYGAQCAVRAKKILEREDSFSIELESPPSALANVARIYGPYKHEIYPVGHNRDPKYCR